LLLLLLLLLLRSAYSLAPRDDTRLTA